jgi:hypothetical protein
MSYPVQDHIHLALNLTGAPEYAPTLTWKTSDRIEVPTVMMAVRRAINGKLRTHTLQQSGNPVVFTGYKYIVRVEGDGTLTTRQRLDAMIAMLGKRVYVCDHYHPNDGQNHTPAVRQMVLTAIGDLKQFTTLLPRYYVEVELTDDYSV